MHSIIAPPTTPVFSRLSATPGIDLRVAYFAETEGDRQWRSGPESCLLSQVLPGRQINIFLRWDTFSFHFNPGIGRFLRETPWDVLINAGWASWSNWQAFIECRRQRKPHVLWAGSTEQERSWQRWVTLPAVRYMVRHSDACVSYGTAAARYLRQLGAAGEVIPAFHCVDNERFLSLLDAARPHRRELQCKLGLQDKRVILFVGRLVERKGVADLLSAFLRLSRTMPEVALLLIGDGPARGWLEALARTQAGGKVIFTGSIQQDDLPAYYQLADLFVLPSREEVWGMVVNEAALAGLPLVVTNCCGAAEDLVREGTNGYLVPPSNVGALQQAMTRVLHDQWEARRMGKASRQLVDKCTPVGVASALAKAARMAHEGAWSKGSGHYGQPSEHSQPEAQ